MSELQRIQVLIQASQHEQLVKLAKTKGQSVSAVIREMIDEGLDQREGKKEAWREALEELTRLRHEIEREHGIITRDFLAEARAEREQDMERVWRGES
ncbi:MAG: ribbon-helix-helix protein, CopG family [Anaerolineae bacterium]|nr:ribbon-helix-helix protein, CopG family [Anaerolineae bacterium]